MNQPGAQTTAHSTSASGYAEFLRVTKEMQAALARRDTEGFCRLVAERDTVVTTIGDQAPASAEERRDLYEAAKLDAEIREQVDQLWQGLVGDIEKLTTGRKAANAYYRSMLGRRRPEGNSKFIDKVK